MKDSELATSFALKTVPAVIENCDSTAESATYRKLRLTCRQLNAVTKRYFLPVPHVFEYKRRWFHMEMSHSAQGGEVRKESVHGFNQQESESRNVAVRADAGPRWVLPRFGLGCFHRLEWRHCDRAQIKASELLFRACMVGEILSAIGFLSVALILYSVFEEFNKPLASLMVTFRVVSIPISCLNVLNKVAVLHILNGASASAGFDPQQISALVMLFLDLHRYGILPAQIFWGLWLLPLGILILKSCYLPRIIGIFLVAACGAYVVSSLTYLLAPAYGDTVSNVAMFVGGLGELPLMLWLIMKGAKVPPLASSRIIWKVEEPSKRVAMAVIAIDGEISLHRIE
jgi:hypothetical protein